MFQLQCITLKQKRQKTKTKKLAAAKNAKAAEIGHNFFNT
jgi:hypothetical protein